MATWIYQRPVDCCHPTELVVAKRLAHLGEEWVIRWGFYYETDREGDFIVLGPTGGVLVLEVKGGHLRKLSTTGRWEGSSRDHPVAQLSAEWGSVIDALRESANGGDVPFVAKALCLPDIDIDQKTPSYREIDRNLIVDRGDLASFEVTWRRLFAKHDQTISKRERRSFLDSFAKEISPKTIEHFISETDRIILRHTIAEYHLLDMLRDNRQLMIEGGPGSGKTWLALEQAGNFLRSSPEAAFSPKGAIRSRPCPQTSLAADSREPAVHPALFVADFPISQDVAIRSHDELDRKSSVSDNPAGGTGRRTV